MDPLLKLMNEIDKQGPLEANIERDLHNQLYDLLRFEFNSGYLTEESVLYTAKSDLLVIV